MSKIENYIAELNMLYELIWLVDNEAGETLREILEPDDYDHWESIVAEYWRGERPIKNQGATK